MFEHKDSLVEQRKPNYWFYATIGLILIFVITTTAFVAFKIGSSTSNSVDKDISSLNSGNIDTTSISKTDKPVYSSNNTNSLPISEQTSQK